MKEGEYAEKTKQKKSALWLLTSVHMYFLKLWFYSHETAISNTNLRELKKKKKNPFWKWIMLKVSLFWQSESLKISWTWSFQAERQKEEKKFWKTDKQLLVERSMIKVES